jgi:hypothetical protein
MTANQAATWHLELDGERRGPLSHEEVIALIGDRKVNRDTLGWQPGFADWKPLSATLLAAEFTQEPPPLHGKSVPNGLIWTLAFAPIIGDMIAVTAFYGTANALQIRIAEAAGTQAHKYWWITVVLNIGLSLWDEHKLRKAGYDTKKMGGAWLVPVYLYRRATVLKHNLGYFFVWIASFFFSLFWL